MKLENDDELERLNDRFARHARDFDDLQNEMSGREVGKAARFLQSGPNGAASSGKSKQERAEALTRLQLLLNDPAYAALYRETATALVDAQSKLESMLERVRFEIERNAAAIDDMRDRAARLEGGTRVYRDKDGEVRNEDGRIIADALAAGIIWSGTEPSFEDIRAKIERRERLMALEADILTGQAEIGEMQAAMDDEDDPRTEPELNDFKGRAEEIISGAEERLEKELVRAEPVTPQPGTQETAGLSVPKL